MASMPSGMGPRAQQPGSQLPRCSRAWILLAQHVAGPQQHLKRACKVGFSQLRAMAGTLAAAQLDALAGSVGAVQQCRGGLGGSSTSLALPRSGSRIENWLDSFSRSRLAATAQARPGAQGRGTTRTDSFVAPCASPDVGSRGGIDDEVPLSPLAARVREERRRSKRRWRRGEGAGPDRAQTPAARALAFALRHAQSPEDVAAIVHGAEAELSLEALSSCLRKLGLEGHSSAALALLHWLRTRSLTSPATTHQGDAVPQTQEQRPLAPGEGEGQGALAAGEQGTEPRQRRKKRNELTPLGDGPNVFVYNAALAALRMNRDWSAMDRVGRWMREDSIPMDAVTLNIFLAAYLDRGMADVAWDVLATAARGGLVRPDLFTVRTLFPAVLAGVPDDMGAPGREAAAAQGQTGRRDPKETEAALTKALERLHLLLQLYAGAVRQVAPKEATSSSQPGSEPAVLEACAVAAPQEQGQAAPVRHKARQRQQQHEVEACLRVACNSTLKALLLHSRHAAEHVGAGPGQSPGAAPVDQSETAQSRISAGHSRPGADSSAESAQKEPWQDEGEEPWLEGLRFSWEADSGAETEATPDSIHMWDPRRNQADTVPDPIPARKPMLVEVAAAPPGDQSTLNPLGPGPVADSALAVLEKMKDAGVGADGATYYWVLRALCRDPLRHQKQIRALHTEMRSHKYLPDVPLCNAMMQALGEARRWWAALEVYECMRDAGPTPGPSSKAIIRGQFNFLLQAACRRRLWKWALQLLERMQAAGVAPDRQSWGTALITCVKANETGSAVRVFQRMVNAGHKADAVAYGALLSALEKGGLFGQAQQVWEHMRRLGVAPNLQSYTTMIAASGREGLYGRAVELFEEMQGQGLAPDLPAFNALITACAVSGQGMRAVSWLHEMEKRGLTPNSVSYEQVALALCNEGQWEDARALIGAMDAQGLDLTQRCQAILQRCMEHLVRDPGAHALGSPVSPRLPRKANTPHAGLAEIK